MNISCYNYSVFKNFENLLSYIQKCCYNFMFDIPWGYQKKILGTISKFLVVLEVPKSNANAVLGRPAINMEFMLFSSI